MTNFQQSTGRRGVRYALVAFAVAVIAILVVALPKAAPADAAEGVQAAVSPYATEAGRAAAVQTNESGLTYGPVVSDEDPSKNPDLIRVGATNGRSGYIYHDTYQEMCEASFAMSPEEATARGEARAQAMAEEIKASAASFYGYDLLDIEVVKDCVDMSVWSNGPENARSTLNAELREAVSSNRTADGRAIANRLFGEDAFGAVKERMIASTAKRMFDDQGVAVSAGLLSVADEATGEEIMQAARESLGSVSLDELMPESLYRQFMHDAKMAVGKKLPVYESDGVTVIGEFVVGEL